MNIDKSKIFNYGKLKIQSCDFTYHDNFSMKLTAYGCEILIYRRKVRYYKNVLTYNVTYYHANSSEQIRFDVIRFLGFLGYNKELMSYGRQYLLIKELSKFNNNYEILHKKSMSFTLSLNDCNLALYFAISNNQQIEKLNLLTISNVSLIYTDENNDMYTVNINVDDLINILRNIKDDNVQLFIKRILLLNKSICDFDEDDKDVVNQLCNETHSNYEDIYCPLISTKTSSVYLSNLRGGVHILGKQNKSLLLLAKSKLFNEYNIKTFDDDQLCDKFKMNEYTIFDSSLDNTIVIFKKYKNEYIRVEGKRYDEIKNKYKVINQLQKK